MERTPTRGAVGSCGGEDGESHLLPLNASVTGV